MPLLGSLANVCTEDKIPDLTKNVPQTANKNEKIPKYAVNLSNFI